MAVTVYSSVSLSYYPTKSCRKALNIRYFPPYSRTTTTAAGAIELVPIAAALSTLIAPAPEEPATLINSSASSLSIEAEKVLFIRECDSEEEMETRNGSLLRRRRSRRRKRRQQMEVENMNTERSVINNLLRSRPKKDGQYLTRKAEAEYSFCLKEEARLEALKKKAENKNGREITLSQWAKAAGMSRISLDKMLCNGREAQERIIRCYRRLVICIATSYQGKGLSMQDLIQEGNLGLLRGAKKFNPQKGYKLSTYVYWWIRQAMTRAIAKKSKITRIPGSISELVPRICEANTVLGRRLGRFPTHSEIATQINKNILTVGVALERNREPISLDQAIYRGGGESRISLQDIIPGPEETTPETMVKKEFMKRGVEKLLCGLCERETNVLKLHFGLTGETPKSFEEIGRHLKLSRERVRQINCIALSKLRQSTMADDLIMYIE